jgi:hexosaminidase
MRSSRLFSSFLCTIAIILFGCPVAFAGTTSDGRDVTRISGTVLTLVPVPKSVERRDGEFIFPSEIGVLLGQAKDADDQFAASELRKELQTAMNVRLPELRQVQKTTIVIGRLGRDGIVTRSLPKLDRGLLDSIGTEGYIVHVAAGKIVVAARTGAGVFYGVQTLKQLIRSNRSGNAIPCVTIVDWPTLRYRGWMTDISRGPIPTMGYLKELVATMAEYKQNSFTLYTEHVFRLRSHPDIAPAEGITPAEIAELSAFAQRYHVELIGNAQVFGHMEHTFKIPFYRPMAENDWVISPAVEGSYTFLKEMFAEVVPAYSSPLFHINCDEVSGLGNGPARRLVDSLGSGTVYANHINRVSEIIRPYGKRLMMWGDIAVENPQIVDRLPKDLIIVSWGYHVADSFVDAILPFKKTGFDFMVAPGVSCWGNVWPNMSTAVVNISNYVRDGAALGAMGMMNTVWVDDGENLGAYNWHGLLWGAECSWDPARPLTGEMARTDLERRSKAFDNAFDALFFGTSGVTAALFRFDSLRALPVRNLVTDQGVWSSMLELYPGETNAEAAARNERVVRDARDLEAQLSVLKGRVQRHRDVLDAASFAAERVLFTGKKNLARVALASAIQAPTPANVDRTRGMLQGLFLDLHHLKNEYVSLWDRENRGWWRDRVTAKYDLLGAQLLDLDKVVFIEADGAVTEGKQRIRCSTPFNDQQIYYTTDGAEPTLRSARYAGPFIIDRPSIIRARVFVDKQPSALTEKYFLVHKAVGKLLSLNCTYSTYDPAYAGGGPMGLLDGMRGSDNFKDGRWQGYQGQDINVVIDLQHPTEINRMIMGFLQSSYSWILMPSRVQFWISEDGNNYTLAEEVPTTVDQKEEGTVVRDFTAEFKTLRTRFVKVVAKYPGKLPAWHHAAGGETFMFSDEIVIE